jgi:signal transduction histidine kinase
MRLDDILDRIVAITADLMDMPVCSVYLVDADNRLVLRSTVGLEPDLAGRTTLAFGEGLPGWVVMTGEALALPDVSRDPRFKPLESELEKDFRSCLCAPLRIQEEVIGALSLRGTVARQPDQQRRLILQTVCKMVAIVIEKARMYQDMIAARELAAVAVSLSGTAHYIKNIMFTTQIAEATIDKALADGTPLKEVGASWQALKEANQEISKMVGNMLNYCRDERPNYSEVDLQQLTSTVLDSLAPLAARRNITVVREFDQEIPNVEIDRTAMHDALLNLVTNGMDAIPPGQPGTVWVRIQRLGGQKNLQIEIADNGTGIPDAVRDKIFNLFFTTKGQGGSGIGLSSTRKIIERHNGTIEFDSTPGEGTCFRIFLPLGIRNCERPRRAGQRSERMTDQ